ncbi:MAG: YdcF family protein [Verrucomicrobiota bacterium]|nr:YdcF family protein [Verrucomicrobiota bacterium]
MNCVRIVLKIGLLLAGLTVLLGLAAWFFPRQFLTLDSGPEKADALVVLGGAGLDRPERAAELFKLGEAPLVICSGYGDAGSYRACLVRSGVPTRDIVLETRSHTTRQNAEFTIALLRARRIHSAIIVTSWYHSRRALACFEHYGPDLKFYSRPSYLGSADRTGKNTAGHIVSLRREPKSKRSTQKPEWKLVRGQVDAEYFKLLGYWVCYGVCPI